MFPAFAGIQGQEKRKIETFELFTLFKSTFSKNNGLQTLNIRNWLLFKVLKELI